jgi:hypothetical protein
MCRGKHNYENECKDLLQYFYELNDLFLICSQIATILLAISISETKLTHNN